MEKPKPVVKVPFVAGKPKISGGIEVPRTAPTAKPQESPELDLRDLVQLMKDAFGDGIRADVPQNDPEIAGYLDDMNRLDFANPEQAKSIVEKTPVFTDPNVPGVGWQLNYDITKGFTLDMVGVAKLEGVKKAEVTQLPPNEQEEFETWHRAEKAKELKEKASSLIGKLESEPEKQQETVQELDAVLQDMDILIEEMPKDDPVRKDLEAKRADTERKMDMILPPVVEARVAPVTVKKAPQAKKVEASPLPSDMEEEFEIERRMAEEAGRVPEALPAKPQAAAKKPEAKKVEASPLPSDMEGEFEIERRMAEEAGRVPEASRTAPAAKKPEAPRPTFSRADADKLAKTVVEGARQGVDYMRKNAPEVKSFRKKVVEWFKGLFGEKKPNMAPGVVRSAPSAAPSKAPAAQPSAKKVEAAPKGPALEDAVRTLKGLILRKAPEAELKKYCDLATKALNALPSESRGTKAIMYVTWANKDLEKAQAPLRIRTTAKGIEIEPAKPVTMNVVTRASERQRTAAEIAEQQKFEQQTEILRETLGGDEAIEAVNGKILPDRNGTETQKVLTAMQGGVKIRETDLVRLLNNANAKEFNRHDRDDKYELVTNGRNIYLAVIE